MTSTINAQVSPNSDALAATSATLASAALGLTAYVLLSDAERREAVARLLRELGVPVLVRGAGAAILDRLAEMVRDGRNEGARLIA